MKVSQKQTTSFCNWTAYKIADFLYEKKLAQKLAFCHVLKKDIDTLRRLF